MMNGSFFALSQVDLRAIDLSLPDSSSPDSSDSSSNSPLFASSPATSLSDFPTFPDFSCQSQQNHPYSSSIASSAAASSYSVGSSIYSGTVPELNFEQAGLWHSNIATALHSTDSIVLPWWIKPVTVTAPDEIADIEALDESLMKAHYLSTAEVKRRYVRDVYGGQEPAAVKMVARQGRLPKTAKRDIIVELDEPADEKVTHTIATAAALNVDAPKSETHKHNRCAEAARKSKSALKKVVKAVKAIKPKKTKAIVLNTGCQMIAPATRIHEWTACHSFGHGCHCTEPFLCQGAGHAESSFSQEQRKKTRMIDAESRLEKSFAALCKGLSAEKATELTAIRFKTFCASVADRA